MEGVGGLTIAVLGLGFVGLTTALGFADKGNTVRAFDIDMDRSHEIANRRIPFLEPGLPEALDRTLGRTFFVERNPAMAVQNCEIVFICVGTPGLPDGSADLAYLFSAIESIADSVSQDCLFVVKSTIPPGTLSGRITPYVRKKGLSNPVAVNPEFLREGKCWDDFIFPDRIVCGVTEETAKTALAKLYEPFNAPVHFVEPNTAEFIKYLSNSLLATLISFSNEMALLAETIGTIDVSSAFRILHEDKRLAGAGINTYIYPGCGYGGYCLPKDTSALSSLASSRGFDTRILNETITLNNNMAKLTARRIESNTKKKSDKIGILGLSFKPESDDVRDSPAAKIIACLINDGYTGIYAYDPVASDAFRDTYGLDITYCTTKEDLCNYCDTLAVITAWSEFHEIKKAYPQKIICDCRYCLRDGVPGV